jgi:hypothetical protein
VLPAAHFGRVIAFDGALHRQDAVARNERIVRFQRNTAARLHAGDEPGIDLLEVRHRKQPEALVDRLAGIIDDRHAEHGPLRVPAAGIVVPLAGDAISAVNLFHGRRRIEHAGDADIGIDPENLVLRFDRKQAGQPAANVVEIDDPGGAAVGLGDRRTHVEHGAGIHLPAAVALRRANLEQAGFAHGLDRFLNNTSVRFAERSFITLNRLEPRVRATSSSTVGAATLRTFAIYS